MMKTFLILFCLFLSASAIAKAKVSYTEIDFINPTTQQPLKISLWYPAGEECGNATVCLADNTIQSQAILLSHGAMGSARELNWIGYATASQGFVTVGINHFGESWAYGTDTIDPHVASKIWQRASEVSVAVDLLESNRTNDQVNLDLFNLKINWQNITAIGFSSGGSTVITLAGGRYAPKQGVKYCSSSRSDGDLGCQYVKNSSHQTISIEGAKDDYRDTRINKVIALDPAAGPMTTETSLSSIAIPVLIIGAKQNDFLPFANHAQYYASTIPNAALYTLENGAGHFVFIDKCQHNFKAMGIELCRDKQGVDREKIHQQLYPTLFQFIYTGR